MNEVEVKISFERIDDIPLIVKWLQQIQINKYIDQKLSKPPGNHQGLSYGQKAFKEKLSEYLKITKSNPERLQVWFW